MRPISMYLLFWMAFQLSTPGNGQIVFEMETTNTIAACGDPVPVNITIANETDKILTKGKLKFMLGDGMQYVPGSVNHSNIREKNIRDLSDVLLEVTQISPCDQINFTFYITQSCSKIRGFRDVMGTLEALGETHHVEASFYTILPEVELFDVRMEYDESTDQFTRHFQLINISGSSFDQLILTEKGMLDIRPTQSNFGMLSKDGKTLTLGGGDFRLIGDRNSTFDPGEIIALSQKVVIEHCVDDYTISIDIEFPCGKASCHQEITTHFDNNLEIGMPRLIHLEESRTGSICDTIFSNGKAFIYTRKDILEQNNIYNIFLQMGWNRNHFIVNDNTKYSTSKCFPIYNITIGNVTLPVLVHPKKGWYVDFSTLTSDPDGPGGLSDLDSDGVFDDLKDSDTIFYSLRYHIRQDCFNGTCSPYKPIFATHVLVFDWQYENYCHEPLKHYGTNRYSSYWDQSPSIVLSHKAGYYLDKEKDTVTLFLRELIRGLNTSFSNRLCDERDQLVIEIEKGRFYSLDPSIPITTKDGKIIPYEDLPTKFRLVVDTSQVYLKIPLIFHCDPANVISSNPRKTKCTNGCNGSLNQPYFFKIHTQYICDLDCPVPVRKSCFKTSRVYVLCEPPSFNVSSRGSLQFGDILFERLSFGYSDSTRMRKVSPSIDSLDVTHLLQYDSFKLTIPLTATCDARFSNIIIRLQNSLAAFKVAFYRDSLLYYPQGASTPQVLTSFLPQRVVTTSNNRYYAKYSFNLSHLIANNFNNDFKEGDSTAIILYGKILDNELSNFVGNQSFFLNLNVSYNQDYCNFQTNAKMPFVTIYDISRNGFHYLTHMRDSVLIRSLAFPICVDSRLNISLQSPFNAYTDTFDPFRHEFRNTKYIESLTIKAPPILNLDDSSAAYEYISLVKNQFSFDLKSTYEKTPPPTVRDSSGWTILTFSNLLLDKDYLSRHTNIVLEVSTKCYRPYTGNIIIKTATTYFPYLSPPEQSDTTISVKVPVIVNGLASSFPNRTKLLYKDSITSWGFKLKNSATGKVKPEDNSILNTWIYLESPSGDIEPLRLTDYTDLSNPVILLPKRIPGRNAWFFGIDSVYLSSSFKLEAKVKHCSLDSLLWRLNSSCDPIPQTVEEIDPICWDIAEQKKLYVDPKLARMHFKILDKTNSESLPCQPKTYSFRIKNDGLGHAYGLKLLTDVPAGVTVSNAQLIPLHSGQAVDLGSPSSSNGTFYWTVPDNVFSNGMSGILSKENEVEVRITYIADCSVENGAFATTKMSFRQVCGRRDTTPKLILPPFLFASNDAPQERYAFHLKVIDSEECGGVYRYTIGLPLLPGNNSDGDKLHIIYDRDLRYIPNSFQPLRNMKNTPPVNDFNDAFESLTFEIEGGFAPGDSAYFTFEMQNTCSSPCTYYDFNYFITSPTTIDCPIAQGGTCNRYIQVQSWQMDSMPLFPRYEIVDGMVTYGDVSGASQSISVDIELSNRSIVCRDDRITLSMYFDANGNGVLDVKDEWLFDDDIQVQQLTNRASQLYEIAGKVDKAKTCPLIILLDPEKNDCICLPDTFFFSPIAVSLKSRHFKVCDGKEIHVGYPLTEGFTYKWASNPYLSSLSDHDPIYYNPTSIEDGETLYDTLYVEIGSNTLCSSLDTVYIEISKLSVELELWSELQCNGDSTAIIGLSNQDDTWDITWEGYPDKGMTLEHLPAGIYHVTIKDTSGCQVEKTIKVPNPEPIHSTIEIRPYYQNYSIPCAGSVSGQIRVIPSGGSPGYQFEWDDGAMDSVRSGLKSGIYTVTVTDKNGCSGVEQFPITEPDSLQVEAITTPIYCKDEDGTASLEVSGGVAGYSYRWDTGDSLASSEQLSPGRYSVTVTDKNGCTKTVLFDIEDLSTDGTVTIRPDSVITLSKGETIQVHIQFDNEMHDIVWSPEAGLSCTDCADPVITGDENTTYHVSWKDKNGCPFERIVTIVIRTSTKHYVPNVFTPNRDGVNDVFRPEFHPDFHGLYDLEVYSRWGELIFGEYAISSEQKSRGWNGIFHGEKMNPGVFAYLLTLHHKDGSTTVEAGNLTLIR